MYFFCPFVDTLNVGDAVNHLSCVVFISFPQHRDSMRLTQAFCGYEVDGRIQEEHGSKWQTTWQQVQRTAGEPKPHSASASQQELAQQPEMQPP